MDFIVDGLANGRMVHILSVVELPKRDGRMVHILSVVELPKRECLALGSGCGARSARPAD
jgi:hypothetical protein